MTTIREKALTALNVEGLDSDVREVLEAFADVTQILDSNASCGDQVQQIHDRLTPKPNLLSEDIRNAARRMWDGPRDEESLDDIRADLEAFADHVDELEADLKKAHLRADLLARDLDGVGEEWIVDIARQNTAGQTEILRGRGSTRNIALDDAEAQPPRLLRATDPVVRSAAARRIVSDWEIVK